MELFLWRHSDALSGTPDFDRELSPLGHQQARKVAEWFREQAPADLQILASPSVRTRQTISHFCKDQNNIQLCMPLYENASPHEILTILGWPLISLPTLLVGHEPQMGMIAEYLLDGTPHPVSFRKGAFWWLRIQDGQNKAILVHAMEP